MSETHVLKTGLHVGESPRWHDDRLWLSNWGAKQVVAIAADGSSEVVVRVDTTIPFSIDWLPEGKLLIVSGPERVILRLEADGSLATYADLAGIVDRGGFNEIVVDGRGNTYVNGPGFDLMAGESPVPGIIVLVADDRPPRQVADGVEFPNGMAVTADNSTLIVAESYGRRLTAFDIDDDGGLSNRRAWADLGDGVPDGICLDREGAAWYADVPNRRCVRVREGGEVLQTVQLDDACFACMLGGAEGRTLFMLTAPWMGPARMFDAPGAGRVLSIEAPAPSAGWPGAGWPGRGKELS